MSLPSFSNALPKITSQKLSKKKNSVHYSPAIANSADFIQEILQTPKQARDQVLCKQIMSHLSVRTFNLKYLPFQNVEFLQKIKKEEEFLNLCQDIELKTFEEGQTIFEQNELGDNFYIILEGSAKVFIHTEVTNGGHFTELVRKLELKEIFLGLRLDERH